MTILVTVSTAKSMRDGGGETAYLRRVGRQSLKCQGSTRRGTGAEGGAGFCREQMPLFSLAVFSAEFPWSDPGRHQL